LLLTIFHLQQGANTAYCHSKKWTWWWASESVFIPHWLSRQACLY